MAKSAERIELDELEDLKEEYGKLMTKKDYESRKKAILLKHNPVKKTGKEGLNGKKEVMDWGPPNKYSLLAGVKTFEAGWQALVKKFKGKAIKNDNPRGGQQAKFLKETDVKWQRKIISLGEQNKDEEVTELRIRMVQSHKGMYYAQGNAKEYGDNEEDEEDDDEDEEEEVPPAVAAPAAAEKEAPAQDEEPEVPPARGGRPRRSAGQAKQQGQARKRQKAA